MTQYDPEVAQELIRRLREADRDAARYKWLCENGDSDGGLFIGRGKNGLYGECGHSAYHYKDHADDAIDTAMKESDHG